MSEIPSHSGLFKIDRFFSAELFLIILFSDESFGVVLFGEESFRNHFIQQRIVLALSVCFV